MCSARNNKCLMVDEQCLLIITLARPFLVEGKVIEIGLTWKSPTVEERGLVPPHATHNSPMIPGLAEADNGSLAFAVAAIERGPYIGEIILDRGDRYAMDRLAPTQFTFVNMRSPLLRSVEQTRNARDLRAVVNNFRRLDRLFCSALYRDWLLLASRCLDTDAHARFGRSRG